MELAKHIKEHEALGIDDGFYTGDLNDSTFTPIAYILNGRVVSVYFAGRMLLEDGSYLLLETGDKLFTN